MTPKLYTLEASPAVRGVLLLTKAIDIDIEQIPIDLSAGEQLTPEFLKLNPQHTVPTLVDDGFAIWDSHAINIYLVEKYAKDNSLYPNDHQKRAVIHQRLHFDSGILFPALANIVRGILREGVKVIPTDKIEAVTTAYEFLETFLGGNKFVAGDYLSIADLSIVSNITTLSVLVPISDEKFPKIHEWLARIQALPYYKNGNQVGLDQFETFVTNKLAE